MSNCQDNRPTFLPEAVWKALMNLPALRYMKAPVDTVAQLYEKYPIGNEKGTFAFVHDKNTFYTYHPRGWHRGEWKPISADSVSSFFEIDAEFLKEGDILVYDSNKKKFVVKSGNVWNKLLGDLKDTYSQVTKFLNQTDEVPTNESDSGVYFVHNDEYRALYIVLGKKAVKIFNSSDYRTKEEVDTELAKKSNQTQVDDIAASVDTLAVTKAEKSVVDALMNGIIKQPAVDTYNDTSGGKTSLLNKYPNPQVGWDVLVREENTRYNWNGSVWVNMETGNYSEDVALSGGSELTMQQMNDKKANVTDVAIISSTLDLKEITSIAKPIHTYENTYIGIDGRLYPYNGYTVKVYPANTGDKVRVKGTQKSNPSFPNYILLSAYTEEGITKIANGTSTGVSAVDIEVNITIAGVNYIAVNAGLDMYGGKTSARLDTIENDIEELKGNAYSISEIREELDGISSSIEYMEGASDTEKQVEHKYLNKYIGVDGMMYTYTNYSVKVYAVNEGDKVQVRGQSQNNGYAYVFASAYTEDNYTKVANGKRTVQEYIDVEVIIPTGVNYIIVSSVCAAYDIVHRAVRLENIENRISVLERNTTNCDGDSLTFGAGGTVSYPTVLNALLGGEWKVNNRGIGGENTVTIGARQGGMPMYIKEPITIPKDGSIVQIPTEVVDGITHYGLYSSFNDSDVKPLLQGGSALINPCMIEGVECTLSWSNNNYRIKRNVVGERDFTTQPKSQILTASMRNTKGINILFIGQNGGYDGTGEGLTAQFEKLTDFKGDGKCIVITSHGNGYPNVANVVKARYGAKHIDLKQYFSTKAIYDAIDLGLFDAATYPTAQDLTDMAAGNAPSSFRVDAIHFNTKGYKMLAYIVYLRMVTLGYVAEPLSQEQIKDIITGL